MVVMLRCPHTFGHVLFLIQLAAPHTLGVVCVSGRELFLLLYDFITFTKEVMSLLLFVREHDNSNSRAQTSMQFFVGIGQPIQLWERSESGCKSRKFLKDFIILGLYCGLINSPNKQTSV